MYVSVQLGTRGEFVVPSFVRKKLGLVAGSQLALDVSDSGFKAIVKDARVVEDFKAMSESYGSSSKKLVMGNALYEGVF